MASHVWDYMICFMRGLSAVVRFCDLGNAKAYGVWNGQRERTHAFCFLRAYSINLSLTNSDMWVLSESCYKRTRVNLVVLH